MFQGEIYAGSLFMQQLLGWNMYTSTIGILIITAIYTIAGHSMMLCMIGHMAMEFKEGFYQRSFDLRDLPAGWR